MDVYKNFRLCGAQFDPSQFVNQNKRKFVHSAIPPTFFSCSNTCGGYPELAPGPRPPPVDCRKMTEEAAAAAAAAAAAGKAGGGVGGVGDPSWMQGHMAHAAAAAAQAMQLSAAQPPIAELKLFMHPKPTMHPHLSQERPTVKAPSLPPGAKGDPTQGFWSKQPDPSAQQQQQQQQQQQAPLPIVKDKMKDDLNTNENHDGGSPSLPGMPSSGGGGSSGSGSRPPRPHSAERQYKCKECGKAFPQPSHLIRHTRTHTGEQPYKCDLCGRAFSDQSHRLRHLRTHIGVRTHKCEECGKEFFEPNHLVRHARRHTGERPYPCDQCGKAFCEQSGLNRHLRTHAAGGSAGAPAAERAYKYPSSPAESTSSAGQPSTSGEGRNQQEDTSQIQKPTEPAWMQGPVAPPNPSGLSCPPPHFLAPLVGPGPSLPFFPSQMQLDSQPLAEVKLVMNPKSGMHPHLQGKGQGKDPAHLFWVKPTDGVVPSVHQNHQGGSTSGNTSGSQQNHHSPQSHQSPGPIGHGGPSQDSPSKRPSSGQQGSRSCSSRSSDGVSPASSVVGSPRSGRDPMDEYRCKECGKVFSQPHHLIRHRRIHTGEQPFKCEMCGKCFSDESHRLRHLRTHIGIRKHRCEECGKEFFERNQLNRHYRRHRGERPWRCLQCDKAFCEESGLKKHMATHSTERPYQCELCSRSFYQRSELQRHAATHTGEKSYKCDMCEKTFSDRHALAKHCSTHVNVSQSHRCQVLWSSFHPGQ